MSDSHSYLWWCTSHHLRSTAEQGQAVHLPQSEAVSSKGMVWGPCSPKFDVILSLALLSLAWISVWFWAQFLLQDYLSHKTAFIASPELQRWVWSTTTYSHPLIPPVDGVEMQEWIEVLNNAITHSLHHQQSTLSLDGQELLSPTDDLSSSSTSTSSSPIATSLDLAIPKKDKWVQYFTSPTFFLLSYSSLSLCVSFFAPLCFCIPCKTR